MPEHQILCDEMDTLIYEYNEIIILFGFVCLFSSAAPLTPIIICALVYIEKFVDTYSIFYLKRVTIIEGASGIEIYNSIIKVFYFIGMLTNIGIVLFTNPHLYNPEMYKNKSILNNNDFIVKFIVFAIMENFVLLILRFFDYNIFPKCKISILFI
jgi:hypothetical protein